MHERGVTLGMMDRIDVGNDLKETVCKRRVISVFSCN